ncbi:ankyrin repeat domain-containing protein [Bacteroidota bacterium]
MRRLTAFCLFVILTQTNFLYGQDLAKYIREGDIDSVQYFFNQDKNINNLYSGFTPLELGIRYNQEGIIRFLITREANINLFHNDWTPLSYSIYLEQTYQSNNIINLLIQNGANLNQPGRMGMSPLILACYLNNSEIATQLYERGADPHVKDRSGNDFFHYVLRGEDIQLIQYFLSKGFVIPRLKSVEEGPYIKWIDNDKFEFNYIQYDSLLDQTQMTSEIIDMKNGQLLPIVLNPVSTQLYGESIFDGISEIFAVSDIHGHYDNFERLLMSNGIIDYESNWCFNDGHLVICGDVFDRGEDVTQCLWLIYKLEKQASVSGGRVHFLLGNHELMIVKDKNKQYVNDKYILLCAKLGIDYNNLFGSDYELGRWLRTRNVIIRINDILFVHGGLPPEFRGSNRSLEIMNKSMHDYLITGTVNSENFMDQQIIQPVWYRGYFDQVDKSKQIKKLLKYYKAKKIVVGHTTVNHINFIQGDNVIAIGTHYGDHGKIAEGLMIENKRFSVRDEYGNEAPLN